MASKKPTIADAIRELMTAEDAGKGPHPDFADLVAHYLGRVSSQEAEQIQVHLDDCPSCKEQILEWAQWETDESPPASDQEVEEVWARLKADPEIIMPTAAPQSRFLWLRKSKDDDALAGPANSRPLLGWLREPSHLRKLAAVLLIATLASTAALISTLIKVGRLQSGEVNVPVAAISKGYKRPVESGTAERPVEVQPGAVLIFTPPDVPEEIPHEVQITRMDGHVVWTGQGLKPSSKGSFHLRLPRDISPGTYLLRITPGEGQEIVVRVTPERPPVTVATQHPDRPSLGAGAARPIGGSEVHRYPIPLEAGEYLHVVVRQQRIDLVVDVLDPNLRRLFRVDTPTGALSKEHVFLLAGRSGTYRVEIRPFNPAVPAGAYQIRIAERRQAMPDDRRRVAADRAFAEARELEGRHPGEIPGRAVMLYREAARLWRLLGDNPRQADALFRLGLMHRMASRPDEALTFFAQALPLWPARDFPQERALLLGEMGVTHQTVGELRAARDRYLEALALYDQAPFAHGRASLLLNLGSMYRQQGRALEALDYLEQARDLLRGEGFPQSEANVLNEMGALYTVLGETARALQLHEQALRRLDPRRDPDLWAATLNHRGNAYLEARDLAAATASYREALALRSQTSNRRGEAVSLTGLATVAVRNGETQRALDLLRRALKVFEEQGEPLSAAIVRNDLGWLHGKRGEPGKALEYHRQAWQMAHHLKNPDLEAAALFGMASAERGRGNLDVARGHIEAALTAVETLRQGTLRADLRTSVLASRQDYYGFLVDLLMELHGRRPAAGYDALALGAAEQSRARGLLDALAENREDLLRGIPPELIDRQRRLRQELQDQEEMRLQGTVRDAGPQVLADLQRRQKATLAAWYAAEEEIRKASPWYASLDVPRSLALSEIQRRVVDRDTLLLEIHLGQPHSVLWVVAPDALHTFRLPGRAALESMARRTWGLLAESRELTDEAPARRAAAELSRHLLGPAAHLLGTKRLVVVAPGALQYIPFAALPEPLPPGSGSEAPFLVERHEIVQLPSASALAVLRQRARRPPPPNLVAVVADPVFSLEDERLRGRAVSAVSPPAVWKTGLPPFDRLPYSAEEAKTILALAGSRPANNFLGFKANRQLVLSGRLAGYRILHLSTHGWLDTEHPELSSLILSTFDAQGRPQDGRLRMHDVYELKLPADLVVLSGCRTAMGREIEGEGLVGIARGFLYAGAGRVAVSLWDVLDRSTAELMRRFYRGLLADRLTPAAALRQAQRSMLAEERWRAPSHWAGFVLVGDWSGRF